VFFFFFSFFVEMSDQNRSGNGIIVAGHQLSAEAIEKRKYFVKGFHEATMQCDAARIAALISKLIELAAIDDAYYCIQEMDAYKRAAASVYPTSRADSADGNGTTSNSTKRQAEDATYQPSAKTAKCSKEATDEVRTWFSLAYSLWKKNAGSFDNALPYHTILRKSEKLIGPYSIDNTSSVAVGKEVQAFTQLLFQLVSVTVL
jgi:hypothetical protein